MEPLELGKVGHSGGGSVNWNSEKWVLLFGKPEHTRAINTAVPLTTTGLIAMHLYLSWKVHKNIHSSTTRELENAGYSAVFIGGRMDTQNIVYLPFEDPRRQGGLHGWVVRDGRMAPL